MSTTEETKEETTTTTTEETKEETTTTTTEEKVVEEPSFCSICKIEVGKGNLRAHVAGKKHRAIALDVAPETVPDAVRRARSPTKSFDKQNARVEWNIDESTAKQAIEQGIKEILEKKNSAVSIGALGQFLKTSPTLLQSQFFTQQLLKNGKEATINQYIASKLGGFKSVVESLAKTDSTIVMVEGDKVKFVKSE